MKSDLMRPSYSPADWIRGHLNALNAASQLCDWRRGLRGKMSLRHQWTLHGAAVQAC